MNAIVILAHGCPVGCLGPYGNEWIATPNLDRLASESVVFDCHYVGTVNAPFAMPDAFQQQFLIQDLKKPKEFSSDWTRSWNHDWLTVLPELDEFHETLVCLETDALCPPWEFSRGLFQAYLEGLLENPELEAEMEPWYNPPGGTVDRDLDTWELLHRSHAAAVTAFDARLGTVFEQFRQRGWDRNAVWVFTSTLGFALGVHGFVGQSTSSLHEELSHLPLIVRYPDAHRAGERFSGFTQPVDIAAIFRGESVMRSHVVSRWEEHRAIRNNSYALIESPDCIRLYEKPKDRWETLDVATQNEDTVSKILALDPICEHRT